MARIPRKLRKKVKRKKFFGLNLIKPKMVMPSSSGRGEAMTTAARMVKGRWRRELWSRWWGRFLVKGEVRSSRSTMTSSRMNFRIRPSAKAVPTAATAETIRGW